MKLNQEKVNRVWVQRIAAKVAFAAVIVFSSGISHGQTDFFWSESPLGGGATNTDLLVNTRFVDSGTLYLYYSTQNSELDTAFGVDLSWSDDGVVNFTSAETFDFGIVFTSDNSTAGTRWGEGFGPAQIVQNESVTGLNAFTFLQGTGIVDANDGTGALRDLGYDAAAQAFLVARVDWELVTDGSTQLLTNLGSIGAIHDRQSVSPSFGSVTFARVPEPSAFVVLALGLAGLAVRRRR